MAFTDNVENKKLARKFHRLEINMNFHRPRAIPAEPPGVPPNSSSVPLDRLSGEESPNVGFRTPKIVVTHRNKCKLLDLDTDQCEKLENNLNLLPNS